MLTHLRYCLAFLLLALVCLTVWQIVHTQAALRRLTNTPEAALNINPSISGDGQVVAFESTADQTASGGSETFRAIRANISNESTTFQQIAASRAPAAAISQDGSHIAFAAKDNPLGANIDGNSEIFLFDGTRLVQVTNTAPGDVSQRAVNGNFLPSISDDGRYIAFSSNRDLANQNADGNLEIVIFDSTTQSFIQLTNSTGIGCTDAKISGNGEKVAYIRERGTTPGVARDLVLQNRIDQSVRVLATDNSLAMTYGRAISDDGQRIVWSTETAANTTQVFLFDGRNDAIRQITHLGSRSTEVPLHPTISGNGNRIAFATRRSVAGTGGNSDSSVELYTFDIPSATFGRVTNVEAANATADVVSSLNDDGTLIVFNYPRVISGPLSKDAFANNSEIYLTATPLHPAHGAITIFNRASMGHEPSSDQAVAPDSIAVAQGSLLSSRTEQSQPGPGGTFPLTVAGTSVTVNGRRAQVFFVSPTEVQFHVPAVTEVGDAQVVVRNSDGFESLGQVEVLSAAPGIFTTTGDGLGAGMVLDADTLASGPFDPSSGKLHLIIFATGVRNRSSVAVTAGSRALVVDSVQPVTNMPGLDEIHVSVPSDLRGAGIVDMVIQADGRESNSATIDFNGDARRDVLINEFLADPPEGLTGDANHDGVGSTSQDEFVELINTTSRDIDVGGYQILSRGSGATDSLRHTFSPRSIIPACSAIVVFGGGSVDSERTQFGGAQVVKASTGSLSLTNTAGVITLRDPSSTPISFVAYGGSTGLNASDNQSLTRAPDVDGHFMKHTLVGDGLRRFSPGFTVTGSTFSPCTPAIARIEVTPSSTAISVADQIRFTVHAFDDSNHELPGIIFTWSSSNTQVATVDQSGLAVGVSVGTSQISVWSRRPVFAGNVVSSVSPSSIDECGYLTADRDHQRRGETAIHRTGKGPIRQQHGRRRGFLHEQRCRGGYY